MNLATLGLAGGLFALLTFNHFLVDWVFQTHKEAMNKSTDWRWRARHCLIYTLGFFPVMYLMGFDAYRFVVGSLILFWSHFAEDTYVPVFLWAKHIRRMPQIRLDGETAFRSAFQTPLGVVLFIGIDQIIHLAFLWVLVWMALSQQGVTP